MDTYGYRFSFGPWNIHEGADPFGPPVRPSIAFDKKLEAYKRLGFDAVQFHDDDAVPAWTRKARRRSSARRAPSKRGWTTPGWLRSSSPRACGSTR